MEKKKCTVCKQEKPVTEFHRRHAGSIGYASSCIECYRAKAAKKKAEIDYMKQFSIIWCHY